MKSNVFSSLLSTLKSNGTLDEIQLPGPFKFTTKWNNVQNDPRDSDLISLTYTLHLISLYHWLERQILRLLWVICMQGHLDYWAIFWFFHPLNTLPSSLQITTSLRITLCWRQPWSTKGFSWLTSELFRWNILVRIKFWFLYCYCESQIKWWYNWFFVFFSFWQIYLWRSSTHQTSLIPVTMDYCCWCM